jgi:hypothetical protein
MAALFRIALGLSVACTTASGVAANQPATTPDPAAEAAPVPAEPVVGTVAATPLAGPFPTRCAAIQAAEEEVDCDLLQDGPRAQHPSAPFLDVRFDEAVFEDGMPDSSCNLFVRTEAGWFHHGLEGMLCGNSGSVRVSVNASFEFQPVGPERLPRLVVRVGEYYSHSMDGEEERSRVMFCGTTEDQGVACTYWWVAQLVRPFDPTDQDGDGETDVDVAPPPDWSADLHYEATDLVVVGAHTPPEYGANLPGIGRFQVTF